ncbi:MAG: HPP family protein [Bacteroidales bacterium]|nr:HPP family protein [Bacteroidales bacterium]
MSENIAKYKRYLCALSMIVLMVAVAEWIGEKEIVFPEMAALAIGMWIVDKKVWTIDRKSMVILMSIAAVIGICIVRYSPLPLAFNLLLAFMAAAMLLLFTATTLIPLISACMLPVLLGTQSWVYPVAVFVMSLMIAGGQIVMEKAGLRKKIDSIPLQIDRRKELQKWFSLLFFLSLIATLSVYASSPYFVLPPLVVTFVEFAGSKAGFRNRPLDVFLLLVGAATFGTLFQLVGHIYFGLPQSVVIFFLVIALFVVFEITGKFFAPAGAVALVPVIIPASALLWFPFQVAVGAALFITIAMLFFQKCFIWSRAHLVYCFVPAFVRNIRKSRN